ncbi:MAG: transglycosylase SLT domain-containing protein [Deltaproteobacteria bacterium]|nr:transglycosylase SLT domain-containing protein [Deltaproteobacteria bacterium]
MRRTWFLILLAFVLFLTQCKTIDELQREDVLEYEQISKNTIPVVINHQVEKFITFFQTRHRKYMQLWLERSHQYLPMMVKVFEENHLPTDLAYLALIESGYNPHAYSRAKAVGIWQFMQATGRRYGLKSNWWIDERRDPVKSTKAAANYLKDLYQIFGSWYLAVAAYNAGEGKILRSVKKHKTDNFWEMAKYRHLKRETKDYIPKFIAAMLIAKDPEKYGFTNLKYQEPISYEEVALTKPVDLHEVAKSIEISYEELKKLNPELKGFSTPLDLDHYTLKVPENKKEIFLVELESIPALKKTDLHQHQVSYGDTLWALSRTYGTSIPQIKKMNNLTSNVLRIGQRLVIPIKPGTQYKAPEA